MDHLQSKPSSTIFKAWMKLGHFLGKINAVVILSFIYCLTVVPLGLAGKLIGINRDKFKFKRDSKSYWVKRTNLDHAKNMKNLF